MSSETNPNHQTLTENDKATLAQALSGMSAVQLMELQTTARKLQRLPFTRLVNALFDKSDGQQPGGDGGLPDDPVPAADSGGSKRSEFMDELFRQIERALSVKTAAG